MYNSMGVHFDDFISYPMKISFHRIFKNGGLGGFK